MKCRIWSWVFALSSITGGLQAQTSLAPFSTFLKANSSIQQIAVGPGGSLFVAGQIPSNGQDVFVARLDPPTARFIWIVSIGGSSSETAGGLAVDAAGSVYVTGSTLSSDFPAVPELAAPLSSVLTMPIPFATKLDSNGAVVYSTLFSNGHPATPSAIVVDENGEAIVSGLTSSAAFPATAGAYNNRWDANPPFITKLDATGTKLVFSVVGVGGSSIALDSANNVFVSGSAATVAAIGGYPITPGAFQTTVAAPPQCQIGMLFCPGVAFIGANQYVTKLSADGSSLIYSTFLTGSLGSYNAGLAADAAGDVWVTGITESTDYPYTTTPSYGTRPAYFTTELNPAGSKVLLSVEQGGFSLALDPQGNIVLASPSPEFPVPYLMSVGEGAIAPFPPAPVAGNTPPQCLAGANSNISNQAYVMRLSSQDGSVLGTQLLIGSRLSQVTATVDSLGNIYAAGSTGLPDVPLTPGIAFDPAVTQRTVSGSFLVRANLTQSQAVHGIECVTDAATTALTGPVAPGQLITLYGNGLGPSQPLNGLGGDAAGIPVQLGGVAVTFDGIPAPLLYVSAGQLNVQVPFEVSRSLSTDVPVTTMQVSLGGATIGSQALAVVGVNPSLFSISGFNTTAVALNQDGTLNSSTNPAKAGSELTLLVNGIGLDAGNQLTGMWTGSNPAPIQTPVAVLGGNNLFGVCCSAAYSLEVDTFTDLPGAISGLGQIQVRVPAVSDSVNLPQFLVLTLTIGGAEAEVHPGVYVTR